MNISTPCTFQGGKVRLAEAIWQRIGSTVDVDNLNDVCCGSGAITLFAIQRGIVKPRNCILIDSGPWGIFWSAAAGGTFSEFEWRNWIAQVPSDKSRVSAFLSALSETPVDRVTAPYIFLLLQSGAFGGKSIRINGTRWTNTNFRSYWKPTQTSRRRSPANPMMPGPDELYKRTLKAIELIQGATANFADAKSFAGLLNGVTYCDPDYRGLYGYGATTLDPMVMVDKNVDLFVSEARPLSNRFWEMSDDRKKGGINGERQNRHVEFLSYFPAAKQ